jgi:PiT family inorganic phosphate transporter
MRPRQALSVAAIAEFAGPFLFGTAVAKTFGAELVDPQAISIGMLMAAILAAITWKLVTWYFGLPSSSSHSLFGGLIGAVIVGAGAEALIPAGVRKIVLALLLSPPLGLAGGYLVMALTLFAVRNATPGINTLFKRGQWFTSVGLALTHGSNNAQKVMGILGLGLLSSGLSDDLGNPLWITASAAGALALGTFFGGSRVMKTVGARFYKIRPVHGFTSQATTSSIILGATLLGGPVSTTQVVSSTIVGVGASERLSKVRWSVFKDIALAWLVTIPATALLAAAYFAPIRAIVDWLA